MTTGDEQLALQSAICIGKLRGGPTYEEDIDSLIASSQRRLRNIVEHGDDWSRRTLALETLVKLFNARDVPTIGSILLQVESSTIWTSRCAALELLSYLGKRLVDVK